MSHRHRKVQYVIRSIAKCRRSQFLDNYLASQPGTRALPAVQCVYYSAPGASSEAKLNISGVTNSFKKYHGVRQASCGGVEAL